MARPRSFQVITAVIIVGCLGLAADRLPAQQSDAPTLDLTVISEFVDPKERISGGAVVGATFFDPDAEVRIDAVYANIPADFSAPLEVQIATIDGRYLAKLVSADPISTAGWHRFDLPTQEHDFLRGYGTDEVAVLVSDVNSGAVIPVRWGGRGATEVIRFQLNTEGASANFIDFAQGDKPKRKLCVPASHKSAFKFDQLCDVAAQQVSDDQGVRIMRKRGVDWGRPIQIKVAYGHGQ